MYVYYSKADACCNIHKKLNYIIGRLLWIWVPGGF